MIAIAVGLVAAVVILNVGMKAQSNLDKMSNIVDTPAQFIFPVVYGLAGSLDELQSEVTGAQKYRVELESYIILHNMSKSEAATCGSPSDRTCITEFWVPMSDESIAAQETSLLESIVKEHMELCKKSHDVDSENIIQNNGGGHSTERGIALYNAFLKGDCNTISKAQAEEQQAYVDKMRADAKTREKQDLIDTCTEMKVNYGSASIGAVCDEVLRRENVTK